MLFNVAGLLNEDVGAIRSGSFSGEKIETDDGVFDEIEGTVKMLRTNATVLVTSEIAAKTTQTCSRCLGPAHLDLEVLIEEEFYPVNADLGSRQGHIYREPADLPADEALTINEKNVLDLSEVVRQGVDRRSSDGSPLPSRLRRHMPGVLPGPQQGNVRLQRRCLRFELGPSCKTAHT